MELDREQLAPGLYSYIRQREARQASNGTQPLVVKFQDCYIVCNEVQRQQYVPQGEVVHDFNKFYEGLFG